MESIVEHFSSFYMYYIFGAIILAPLIFFTRRWSLPVIFYITEIIIYLGIMHCVLFVLVKITAWFKDQSSMDRAFSRSTKPPDWGTPILEFWDRAAYKPAALFWVEVVLAVLIILVVWRYRPMQTGNPRRRRKAASAKKLEAAREKGLLPKKTTYNDD